MPKGQEKVKNKDTADVKVEEESQKKELCDTGLMGVPKDKEIPNKVGHKRNCRNLFILQSLLHNFRTRPVAKDSWG